MAGEKNPESVIDRNTSASGTLKSDGDVRVDGALEGKLIVQGCATISPSGRVTGSIRTRIGKMEGWVQGTVTSDEKLHVLATSIINADVTAPVLSVDPGATVQGNFVITPNEEERKRLRKDQNAQPATFRNVKFALTFPQASDVKVVGDFNDWDNAKAVPLLKSDGNQWIGQFRLSPGIYQYLVLVDGNARLDPTNPNKTNNSFGSENSVLTVK